MIAARSRTVLDVFLRRGGVERTVAKVIARELEAPSEEAVLGIGLDGAVAQIEAEITKWMCAPITHEGMGGVCVSCAHKLSLIAKLHALRSAAEAAQRDATEVRDDLISAYETLVAVVDALGLPRDTDGPALVAAVQSMARTTVGRAS